MLSKTSYFNATLFRKNLTRFWPLWGLATFFGAIFPLAFLVQILQNSHFLHDMSGLEMTQVYYSVVDYGVPLISLFYSILCAMCVWNYLYNARSVGFLHTLPIRREGLFVTNFLSGMTMIAIPYAVTGALCILLSVLAGDIDLVGILVTILAVAGESFFYFASATAVAFVTSNIMALPVLYFIFHFLAVLMDMLISVFAQGFFFGYQGDFTGVVNFLSPTVFLMEKIQSRNIYEEVPAGIYKGVQEYTSQLVGVELENGWIIAVYALVGVALTAVAWFLYQRRRSESAGEVVAVGWMKPVFRYGVSFCGALAGGLLLYYMFWGMYQGGQYYDLLPLLVSMAVAGAIGYYLASMLLAKSLRVFKGSWKGLSLVAVAVAVVCIIMHFDLLGVESRVPSVESVESVQVRMNTATSLNVTLTEPKDIQRVQEVHRAVLAEKDTLIYRNNNSYIGTDANGKRLYYEYSYLRLIYTLKGGVKVERRYPVYYLQEEVDRPGTAVNALKEFYSSDAVQYANLMGGMEGGRILSAELSYPTPRVYADSPEHIFWEWDYKSLTTDQAEALVEAIRKDIAAGNFGRNAFDNERWEQETYAASLEIHYKPMTNGQIADWNEYLSLKFSVNSTNLIAELERQGILKRTELYTEYEVYTSEKYGKDYLTSFDPNSAPAVEDIIAGAVSESSSVGIIGGADGPTAIFVTGG